MNKCGRRAFMVSATGVIASLAGCTHGLFSNDSRTERKSLYVLQVRNETNINWQMQTRVTIGGEEVWSELVDLPGETGDTDVYKPSEDTSERSGEWVVEGDIVGENVQQSFSLDRIPGNDKYYTVKLSIHDGPEIHPVVDYINE